MIWTTIWAWPLGLALAATALALLLAWLLYRHEGTLRGLVLARVPILFALTLLLLPPLSVWRAWPMLSGVFVLRTGWEMFWATLTGVLVAWMCGLTWLLVWEYTPLRLPDVELRLSSFWRERRLLRVLPWTLLTTPLMFVLFTHAEIETTQLVWPAALGLLVAGGLLLVIASLRRVVLDPLQRFLFEPIARLPARWLPQGVTAGYIEMTTPHAPARLLPGHVTAAAIFLVLGAAYVAGQLLLQPDGSSYLQQRFEIDDVVPWQLPTLAYVMMLVLLWTSFLTGATFFFDRFRVPLLLILFVWSFLCYSFGPDHTFQLILPSKGAKVAKVKIAPTREHKPTGEQIESASDKVVDGEPVAAGDPPPEEPAVDLENPPTIRAALSRWLRGEETAGRNKPPVIVVCASGGGLQATAWTTRVLTWLQEDKGVGERFARSIRCISATSGGSLGAIYYLHAFKDGAPPATSLAGIRDAGVRSSLSEIGWGIVFPDFQRAFFPAFVSPRQDRGWAAEQAWRETILTQHWRPATLRQWRDATRKGELPAVILNSYIIETGERMLFNTVTLPHARRARTFAKVYGESADIDMTTATRLSATFPYVAPIARASLRADESHPDRLSPYHYGDGGYFDNFGVMSAAEWIAAVLADDTLRDRIGPIVIVELRAFGETEEELAFANIDTSVGSVRDCDPPEERPGSREGSSRSGWFYAIFGPADGLLKMRDSTQIARNNTEICLLRDHYPGRIHHVVFQPTGDLWPLSWHMTDEQQAALDAEKVKLLESPARQLLADLLAPPEQTASE